MAKNDRADLHLLVPQSLKKRFKQTCLLKDVNMSDVGVALIEQWLEENEVSIQKEETAEQKPESFTELVRQNYFALMNNGKINHMRLKELSFGQKPNAKEVKLIAEVLEVTPEDLEKLVS